MTPRDFCYWLQGHLELTGAKTIDAMGTKMIREHLDLVFTKKTKTKRVKSPKYCAKVDGGVRDFVNFNRRLC